jgi:hypothetical protein
MHGSRERAYVYFMILISVPLLTRHRKMLTSAPVGVRLCICLLDRMVALYDADESSDGGKAFDIG